MVNKLSERHSGGAIGEFYNYTVTCPCCLTALNFGKDDVYMDKDAGLIPHEYIDCPECKEKIQLTDYYWFNEYH